ncbi:unnamed protein product [Symbiodinium sp. CCMP2592]|nr:unnamed protein product [Symbiodinium sp. CCMP2592]
MESPLMNEGLPPSSPVVSPVRKKSKQEADEAELIAAREAQQPDLGLALNGGKPEWVTDLKQHIAEQFGQFSGLISGFNQRLMRLEEDASPQRLHRMEEKLVTLETALQEIKDQGLPRPTQAASRDRALPHHTAAPITGLPDYPRKDDQQHHPFFEAGRVGPGMLGDSRDHAATHSYQTDYNHVIVGGWEDGTKRDVILKATSTAIEQHHPPLEVDSLQVYGKRGSICHMYLKPSQAQTAYERYQSIRSQIHDKIPIDANGHGKMWFTASKPKAVRMRNRRTMLAKSKLEQFLTQISSQLELDVEWSKGLIWLGNKRIAADTTHTLSASNGQYVIAMSTDPTQAEMVFHFNLTNISNMTGEEQCRIEAALHRLQ